MGPDCDPLLSHVHSSGGRSSIVRMRYLIESMHCEHPYLIVSMHLIVSMRHLIGSMHCLIVSVMHFSPACCMPTTKGNEFMR
jgi:hypothetical protein